MGGVMIWKVLWDYHRKIENSLNRYTKGETQLLSAILEEIEIYGALEEEVIFPGLASVVSESALDAAQASLDRIKDLSVDIENLDPGDPNEGKLMRRLVRQWGLHTGREEAQFFPAIKTRLQDEQYVMARQAFTTRQELVAARGGVSPPGQYHIGLPGSGWTKQLVVGGGW